MISLLLTVALAGDFDHNYAALDAFYDGAVSAKGVDYGVLTSHRSHLDQAVSEIESASLAGFSDPQKLAFYINAYNVHTLTSVLDAMPLKSIMELDGGKVWDVRKFTVAGSELTLNQIEHEYVRKLGDGRIHAAVNCASKGCPPLQPDPFRATTLEAQLDAAARIWASHNAWTLQDGTLQLSSIFDWYSDDFVDSNRGDIAKVDGKHENAIWFVSELVSESDKATLLSGEHGASWLEYDWALNAR